jgi:2-keto-4-pentenoate hydratase/2-oxohepta-3-ene-1,7-dioic acid hydratase in catechol pathway
LRKNLAPPTPYIFWRPSSCIADPYANITVYPIQQDCLDYEGELVILAGYEPFKDITVEEAKKQIIGYSVGNDFSPRPGPKLGQMNYIWSKSFDKFTPVGPVLVSADVLGVPPSLELNTRVNGRVVQHDNTRNMTHDVAKIVSALSIGMFFNLLTEVLGASRMKVTKI